MTRDDVFERLILIFQEKFEIEPARVTLQATLSGDLDLDSIDVVDLLTELKPVVGRRLEADLFKSVRTVQDLVDVLLTLMVP